MTMDRSWVEISRAALRANVRILRAMVGRDRILCAVVKANAYGHGITEMARLLKRDRMFRGTPSRSPSSRGGETSDWFGVDSVGEAELLRDVEIRQPILILGYVPVADARRAAHTGAAVTVAEVATLRALARVGKSLGRDVLVHCKVETGTQRQGIALRELPVFIRGAERLDGVRITGISTHLADVEDTGPDGFARVQLERFERAAAIAERVAGRRLLRHASASAGAMLLPDARLDLVRTGIALYGLWPSERVRSIIERRSSRLLSPSNSPSPRGGEGEKPKLHPVLTWKTIVGPMHWVPKGAPVGYGCTERVARRTRIAVLPVGYWDGYDRKLSSVGTVLIRGKRCKVIGRVCMNMMMVDVTDVPSVRLEDEVVLIGRQEREEVTVDELAGKIGTINYEVVTRINPWLTRRVV